MLASSSRDEILPRVKKKDKERTLRQDRTQGTFRNTGRAERPYPSFAEDRPEFLEAVSSDGRRVLEAELGDEAVGDWIVQARRAGAELLWLHTNVDLAVHGFERFPGYVRMRTERPPRGEPLARLRPEHYVRTLEGAYHGLWGHKLISPDAEPRPGAVVLGLYERREPIGLCTVFTAQRLVDGPGVLPNSRDAAVYTRLLLGACADLGAGRIELDSWGDCSAVIDAYREIGFEIVDRAVGWQFRLD